MQAAAAAVVVAVSLASEPGAVWVGDVATDDGDGGERR